MAHGQQHDFDRTIAPYNDASPDRTSRDKTAAAEPLKLKTDVAHVDEDNDYDAWDDESSIGNDDEYLIIRSGGGHAQGTVQEIEERDGSQRGSRKAAVSFSRIARLENGNYHDLRAPLPSSDEANTVAEDVLPQADQNSRIASSEAIAIRTRPRRHTETQKDAIESDADTTSTDNSAPRIVDYVEGQLRYPLVQSTIDELALEARRARMCAFGQIDTSAVQLNRKDSDPLSKSAILSSPVSYTPLTPTPQSAILPSRRSVSQRSFGSIGSVGRRHQFKSNTSSLTSPAHSFLSQWTRGDVATKEPEPDDEGQEVGGDSGYIIGRRIGYGGFSVVKEATTIENSVKVVRAVKIVRKQVKNQSEEENERLQAEFEREVGLWRYLKHQHVLPLIAVYDTPFATFCITKLNQGGTLFDLVRAHRKLAAESNEIRGLSSILAKRYLYQLASAIRYLHEDVRVVHRDIKPENCLIDMSISGAAEKGGNLLLCDFGMADFIHNDHRTTSAEEVTVGNKSYNNVANIGPAMSSTNIQGSLEYAAPELLSLSEAIYSPAVDIWAYGCVAYVLFTAKLPFSDELKPRLAAMIQSGDYDTKAMQDCRVVSEDGLAAIDFVQSCLALDTDDRSVIGQLLEHEWFSGCKELYEMIDEDL